MPGRIFGIEKGWEQHRDGTCLRDMRCHFSQHVTVDPLCRRYRESFDLNLRHTFITSESVGI